MDSNKNLGLLNLIQADDGPSQHELKGMIDNLIFSHRFHASWRDFRGQIENFPFLFLIDLQLYFPFLFRHELADY